MPSAENSMSCNLNPRLSAYRREILSLYLNMAPYKYGPMHLALVGNRVSDSVERFLVTLRRNGDDLMGWKRQLGRIPEKWQRGGREDVV